VSEGSLAAGKQLVNLQLPREAHIMLVKRKTEYLVPRRNITLKAGDILSVLDDRASLAKVRSVMNTPPSVAKE